ncbi:hypothetical protein M9458_054294, partial [Cirrhinus mrigala]
LSCMDDEIMTAVGNCSGPAGATQLGFLFNWMTKMSRILLALGKRTLQVLQ